MLRRPRESADVAIRIAAIVIDVLARILLFVAAGAGVPMPALVCRPFGRPDVRMSKRRRDDITTGRAGLRRGFRCRSARRMRSRVLLVSAYGAEVIMAVHIALPSRGITMTLSLFLVTDGTSALVLRVAALRPSAPSVRRGLRDFFRLRRAAGCASIGLDASLLAGRRLRHGAAVPSVIGSLFQITDRARVLMLIVINL